MNYFKLILLIVTVYSLTGCGGAEERKAVYLEKAKLSLEAGDLDKARVELKNVLQIDPKDAQAYFQLGYVFELQKDYRKAFRNYTKSEELAPDNLEVHARIGRFYLLLAGDIDKALEKRDLILGKDGADVDGLLLKAGILYIQNDLANAKKIAQDIFSKHPEHIENTVFLATLYELEKNYDGSLDVLTVCLKENPANSSLKNMLAFTYMAAGKYELAEKMYKIILEKNPELFSSYVKLVNFYQKIGDLGKAEDVLRKAINEDKDDSERKLVLVEFIKQTKGNKEAIELLQTIIAKNPSMSDLRPVLAKLYIAEKNSDEAVKVFKSIVSNFSEEAIGIKSRVYLASMYMQNGNIDEAANIIDDAIKISPNDSQVNFVKAKLLLINKDYEGAIILLRTVIKDEPENIEAYFLLSAAHSSNGEEEQSDEIIDRAYENNRTNAAGLIELARYHFRKKNIDKLEKVVDNYLSKDANNYEALSYKSEVLNVRKMFSEAKIYAARIIKYYPDKENGYIQSLPYMLTENKGGEAVILLEDGYNKVKENSRILELLVSLYVDLKDFDAAENTVQSSIRENGETAELYMLLSKVQFSSSKIDAAITSLLKAIGIKPALNEPYLRLANLYIAIKDNQKAIDVLQQGLTELKDDLKLTFVLAKIYEDLGDYNSAISEYEKAYESFSNNIILINNLTVLLSEHRKDENSLKFVKELASKLKNSDQAVILDTVGWVYYKIGDYSDAVNVLKVVVEKSPDVAVFNYHLGMALYKTGDEAAAKIYLTNSLTNNKNFPGKIDAEAQLNKLQ